MTRTETGSPATDRLHKQRLYRRLMVVLVVGASAARVLPYAGVYSPPPEVWAVLWGYAALFGTFGAVYLWLRYRP